MWWVLAAAVFGISISGVLVRSMHDADALAIAAWRTALAGLVLSPGLRLLKHRISRGEAARIICAGVCLGMHFYVWFLSLEHTTVMRSTVLVCLLPIWVGLLEWLVEREFQGRAYWGARSSRLLASRGCRSLGEEPRNYTGTFLRLLVGFCVLFT